MKTTIFFLLLILSFGLVKASNSSDDGEKSPASHNILSNQLPARLLTVIHKNYKDYWITDLYKENVNGKISYFITMENADQTVKLNTSHSTGWAVTRILSKDSTDR